MKTKLAISILVCLLVLVPYGALRAMAPTSKKILAALGGKLRVPEYTSELVRRIADITNATPLADEVDELVKVGNLQEIMWRLHDEGLVDEATQLEKIISNRLATDEIVAISKLDGTQGSQLVEFASGLRGVYKNFTGGRELAVYRLDQLLGTHVFPLTTVRTIDGETGSVQLFIENATSARDAASLYFTEAMNTLRLLANDGDHSNPANYLYPYKGRAIAIDGGYAFHYHFGEFEELWRYFNDSRGEKLANLDVDLQKKYPDLAEGYRGLSHR